MLRTILIIGLMSMAVCQAGSHEQWSGDWVASEGGRVQLKVVLGESTVRLQFGEAPGQVVYELITDSHRRPLGHGLQKAASAFWMEDSLIVVVDESGPEEVRTYFEEWVFDADADQLIRYRTYREAPGRMKAVFARAPR